MHTSGFRTWAAYRKAFVQARSVYRISANFPRVEYSMIDQIRRSSRSVCANLAEVYGVRSYPRHYRSKLSIAIAENYETQVWLDFAFDTKYIDKNQYRELCQLSEEVGKLLTYMLNNPARFANWKVL
ncbi:four helix bundle protein [Lewinella sp. IMCC34191]|uniref:four helix bundle protein n=1 Tax=Lewinella sp. IMCC34191 TaxID=2259172 RepID=UPI000E280C2D|nr:four helix bundle protein [Lewinella sp. IMCC34191]